MTDEQTLPFREWAPYIARGISTKISQGIRDRFAKPDVDEGRFKEAAAEVSPIELHGFGQTNPHPLLQTKTLDVVDDMMTDESVGTFIEMKKTAALATSETVTPASKDDERHVEHSDYIKHVFERMTGTLKDDLYNIVSAVEYGFSVTNKVFELIDDGPFRGKIGLRFLKTKRPHNFTFDTDEFNNIKPKGLVHTGPNYKPEHLAVEDFVLYTYRKRFGDHYGYGDCIRAYDRWNSKVWILKFWDVYLERTATGTVIAKQPANAKKYVRDRVDSFLKQKTIRSSLRVPDDWDIEMHETTGRGNDVFEASTNHRVRAIARAIFLPDLLGFSDKPSGSYALGKKHFDVFLWILGHLRQDLSETIMAEQIIRDLIDKSYGPQEAYPAFGFEPLTDEQKIAWLTNVLTAIEKGGLTPDLEIENRIREMHELSEKEEEEESRAGGSPLPPKPKPGGDDSDGDGDLASFVMQASQVRARRQLTKYERKVDVDGIATTINDLHDQFTTTWADLFAVQQKSTIEYIRKKKVIANGDMTAVENLRFPRVTDMRKALARYALSALYYGALQAQQEIERAKKQKFESALSFRIALDEMKLDEVEKFFIQKGLIPSTLIRTAAAQAKREAFFITGVEGEKVLNQARMIIFRGIRRGDQIWAEGELRKLFDGYLSTGELTDRALGQAWRIETIARNQFGTAFNEGRKAYLRDPDVDDFIEAYQWSSVLDDGTTDYCMEMDQRVLRKEDLDSIGWPQAHHGCRAFVTPIVKGEEFTFDAVPTNVKRGVGFEFYPGLAA